MASAKNDYAKGMMTKRLLFTSFLLLTLLISCSTAVNAERFSEFFDEWETESAEIEEPDSFYEPDSAERTLFIFGDSWSEQIGHEQNAC